MHFITKSHLLFSFSTETNKLLQRSILVAAGPNICDITIDTLNSYRYINLPINCDVIATTSGDVSYFTLAMHTREIYYAKEDIIFRQELFETSVALNISRQNRISGTPCIVTGYQVKIWRHANVFIIFIINKVFLEIRI